MIGLIQYEGEYPMVVCLNFSLERYLRVAGEYFLLDEDHEAALQMVEKALLHNATDIRALILKGDILYCINADEAALAVFKKIVKIYPDCVEALISMATIYEHFGQYRKGLTCCETAFVTVREKNRALLPSLYDQTLSLLVLLNKYSQAKMLLKEARLELAKNEIDFLESAYKPIILNHLAQRKITQDRRQQLERPQSVKVVKLK
ncbi:MAG: hypothetical protein AAGI66_03745 [Cyanobacteria bacterium P01_H01_bin.74]